MFSSGPEIPNLGFVERSEPQPTAAPAISPERYAELEAEERARARIRIRLGPRRDWSPGAAAALSFVVPGLGQIHKGQLGAGVAYLFCTLAGLRVVAARTIFVYTELV